MMNPNRAMYRVIRPFALAAMLLSVAPVLAGCYGALNHPIQHFSSTGESVVYQSGDVAAVNHNQLRAAPKSYWS